MKKIILLVLLSTISLFANANDTIRFTWQVGTEQWKLAEIGIAKGETYTVRWGDGTSDTTTFIAFADTRMWHRYADTGRYDVIVTAECLVTGFYCIEEQLTILDVSGCTNLEWLYCENNQLTALDVSGCVALEVLYCYDNQLTALDVNGCMNLVRLNCCNNQLTALEANDCTALELLSCADNQLTTLDVSGCTNLEWLYCENNQLTALNMGENTCYRSIICENNRLLLSYLFAASQKINNPCNKIFGTQNLFPLTVMIGDEIDYSDQHIFGGMPTFFDVNKNDSLASENDYSITEGKITFHRSGNYIVIMTNWAVVSNPYAPPAQVIVEIEVLPDSTDGIVEPTKENFTVYPNPTTGQLTIENVELFDIYGKSVLRHCERSEAIQKIDASHLENGIYFMKITTDKGMSVKKIIKL